MKPLNLQYIPVLTFPRFLAAILVVLFHFGLNIPSIEDSAFAPIILKGHLAVSFFFFLSGFLLYLSSYRKPISLQQFYLKRLYRIYPVYLLCFLSMLVLLYWLRDWTPVPRILLYNVTGMHAWRAKDAMVFNYPSWTLSVEIFFYALFPFVFKLFLKQNLKVTFILTFLVWTLSFFGFLWSQENIRLESESMTHNFLYYNPMWHLNTFVFGIFGGKFLTECKTELIKSPFFLLITVICAFTLLHPEAMTTNNHNGLWSPAFFVVCILLVRFSAFLNPILGSKPLVFLGNASYALYLFQYPLAMVFFHYLKANEFSEVSLCIYILTLIAISAVIYAFFEKPAHALLSNRTLRVSKLKYTTIIKE